MEELGGERGAGGGRGVGQGIVRRRGKGIKVQESVFVAIPFQQRVASKRESHTSAGQET